MPTTAKIEHLAAVFHTVYQYEAERQGDVRHPASYARLPENIKNFDRCLARYALRKISQAEAAGFKRGLERAARFEETTCLEGGKLVQHTKDEANIERQLKAEAIRACRRQAKAKDAVIVMAQRVKQVHTLLPDKHAELEQAICDLEEALEALDKEKSDAE